RRSPRSFPGPCSSLSSFWAGRTSPCSSRASEGDRSMLQVERLTKRYGALPGIADVSFSVQPGEILGLLAPNGSGKSTTVKILTGLLSPTAGRVLLDGRDVAADVITFKSSLGYVPEEPHLYSYLTGPEYLWLVGRLRNLADDVLESKIERF